MVIRYNRMRSINSFSANQRVLPGQYKRLGGINVFPSYTNIQNNFYGGGFDGYDYGCDYGCDNGGGNKLMNWIMGLGLGATFLGGILSLLGGKKDNVETKNESEEQVQQQNTKKPNKTENMKLKYWELRGAHDYDGALPTGITDGGDGSLIKDGITYKYQNNKFVDNVGNNLLELTYEEDDLKNLKSSDASQNAGNFATSMMNRNDESSVIFKDFDSKQVIKDVTGDNKADGITLNQLLSYLQAQEKLGESGDFDNADAARVINLFKRFAGDDNVLDSQELDNLKNELVSLNGILKVEGIPVRRAVLVPKTNVQN